MIKRYECIRDTHRMGNDGPWVTYEDHAEEITTLRAEVERLREWQRQMVQKAADNSLDGYRELGAKCASLEERTETAERERDEAEERARFNARLAEGLPELVREQDTLRADVERWVKEVAHLKLAAEKAERISNEPSR